MSKNKYKKKVDELDIVELEDQQEEKENAESEEQSNEKSNEKSDKKSNKNTKIDSEEKANNNELLEKEELNKEELNKEELNKRLEDDVKVYKAVGNSETDVNNLELKDKQLQDLKSTDEYLTEIKDLKKSNETLIAENQALKSELSTKEEQFGRSLEEMQINNAVDVAIREANGKNVKAIKALINFDEISLDGSGEVVGLVEQIDTLKTSENSSFLFDENELILKGATPVSSAKASGISVADFQKMSYRERLELYNKDSSLYKTLKY